MQTQQYTVLTNGLPVLSIGAGAVFVGGLSPIIDRTLYMYILAQHSDTHITETHVYRQPGARSTSSYAVAIGVFHQPCRGICITLGRNADGQIAHGLLDGCSC